MVSVCLSMFGQGLGTAMLEVASFSCAMQGAINSGFQDSTDLQASIGGLFISFFALGNFLGPTISGILFDVIGFGNNSMLIICFLALIIEMNLIFNFKSRRFIL